MRLLGYFCILLSAYNLQAYEFRADFRVVAPDMVYSEGKPAGPIKELVTLALKRAGHSITWEAIPWKRTQHRAELGKMDFLVRHSMNDKRRGYLKPILMGYQKRQVVFLTSPKKDVHITKFSDLQNYTIGQIRGYFYAPQYNDADSISKLDFNDYQQLGRVLAVGRVDAIIVNSDSKSDLEMLLSIPGVKMASYQMTLLNGRYSSIPIKSPAIKFYKQISAEFFKLRQSGEMTQILKQYGSKPFEQDFSTRESQEQEAFTKIDASD